MATQSQCATVRLQEDTGTRPPTRKAPSRALPCHAARRPSPPTWGGAGPELCFRAARKQLHPG
eukprot:7487704-Alexandrium_andersonii.AAC.1